MNHSPFYSGLHDTLLSDPEIAGHVDAGAQIASMLHVEAALAQAEAHVGIIPESAAEAISAAVETIRLDLSAIRAGMARDGIPVPALVEALREEVGSENASRVHWGATSQDIVDSAWVLQIRDILALLDDRLESMIDAFVDLADRHRRTTMIARTRSQQAAPTTFGLKAASWGMPLIRQRERMVELKKRLLMVQLGGAVGTLSPFRDKGVEVVQALAAELNLNAPSMPWHSQRDSIVELANWLALMTGSLGKFGRDIVLLSQSEVSEVHLKAGGGSSTLPQKNNPVGAETLVTFARANAGLMGSIHQAMVHEHERDGAAWQMEWLVVPQMLVTTGAALLQARLLVDSLEVDTSRMQSQISLSQGLILAEPATFALAQHIPKQEAHRLVKSACAEIARTDRHLVDILQEKTDAPVNWETLKEPENSLGVSNEFIDSMINAARSERTKETSKNSESE